MQKINQAFEEFIVDCQIRNLKSSTIKVYGDNWNVFTETMGIQYISELTSLSIKKYTAQMMSRDLSPHTINCYLRCIRTVVNWMADEEQEIIPHIKVRMVKAPTTPKDTFSEIEHRRLLQKPLKSDKFNVWRNWLTASILLNTGMRGATLRDLKWEDIDTKTRVITLMKTKTNGRIIPLSNELLKCLLSFKRMFNPENTSPVIATLSGKPIAKKTMEDSMKRYQALKGIPFKGLHKYRRTFITFAVIRGVDSLKIARMVGHSDLQMINKHYLPNSVELLRDVVDF